MAGEDKQNGAVTKVVKFISHWRVYLIITGAVLIIILLLSIMLAADIERIAKLYSSLDTRANSYDVHKTITYLYRDADGNVELKITTVQEYLEDIAAAHQDPTGQSWITTPTQADSSELEAFLSTAYPNKAYDVATVFTIMLENGYSYNVALGMAARVLAEGTFDRREGLGTNSSKVEDSYQYCDACGKYHYCFRYLNNSGLSAQQKHDYYIAMASTPSLVRKWTEADWNSVSCFLDIDYIGFGFGSIQCSGGASKHYLQMAKDVISATVPDSEERIAALKMVNAEATLTWAAGKTWTNANNATSPYEAGLYVSEKVNGAKKPETGDAAVKLDQLLQQFYANK